MITTKFKHSLPVQQIVVRQDAKTDTKFLPSNVGQMYPLIRIKEQTIEFADIVQFNLSIGEQFLPIVTVTIDDAEQKFKESNFIEKNDIITIYVGNALDTQHDVIKNDYYVISVQSSPNTYVTTIEAVLHVPKLFDSYSRHFDMTSVQVFEAIAKESGLGFATNADTTEDKMNWIQHQTNYDFLEWVLTRSLPAIDSKLLIYVDQYANLNCIDLKKALDTSASVQLTTEPITGTPLEQPILLKATNNVEGDEEQVARITAWSPITDYGQLAKWYPSKTVSLILSSTELSTKTVETVETSKQLKASSTWTHFDTDSVFEKYASSKVLNVINSQLLQGIKLSLNLDYFIPVIHNFMTLPVEIWNTAKLTERLSQDPNVTNETLETIEPIAPSNTYEKNARLTGDYLVQSMQFSYTRKSNAPDEDRKMTQSLQTFLKRQSTT